MTTRRARARTVGAADRDRPLEERYISVPQVMEQLNELVRRGQVELVAEVAGLRHPLVLPVDDLNAWLVSNPAKLRLRAVLAPGPVWDGRAMAAIAGEGLDTPLGREALATLGQLVAAAVIAAHLTPQALRTTLVGGEGAPDGA